MPAADRRTTLEHADPILRVEDMTRALRYYVDVLGFTNADWGSDEMKVGDPDGHVLRFGSEPRTR